LDRSLIENNIKISVITESEKKFQGTKETEHCAAMFSGVHRHTEGSQGLCVMWVHKSMSNKIDHYKFRNNRVIEARLKTERGRLTILAVMADGRQG
jgi:hypothetical protein